MGHKSWIWQQQPVMTPNVCAKYWKTKPCQMKPVWNPWKTNSRMPEYWPRRLTKNTMTAKKLQMVESDLDRAEERADTGETKIIELEEELRVVGNNLKSLEVSEEKANQREEHYKEQIKHLTAKLKQAEARAEFAERSVQKLQKEVDRLEDELVHEKEKFKAVSDELDQTFAEMSGY